MDLAKHLGTREGRLQATLLLGAGLTPRGPAACGLTEAFTVTCVVKPPDQTVADMPLLRETTEMVPWASLALSKHRDGTSRRG